MPDPLASYDSLSAVRGDGDDGGVVITYGRGASVHVTRGDRLTLTWGGPGPAAIGTTPFELEHHAPSKSTVLFSVTLLDERDPDYGSVLHGLQAFVRAVAAEVEIDITEAD